MTRFILLCAFELFVLAATIAGSFEVAQLSADAMNHTTTTLSRVAR